jgi:hypothetical protein
MNPDLSRRVARVVNYLSSVIGDTRSASRLADETLVAESFDDLSAWARKLVKQIEAKM